MPLYIDIHKVPGATANDLAQAHAADMQVQGGLGVCCVKYWFNEGSGKVFCLIEAPSADAANEVHARSHGLLAEKIIEVDPDLFDVFLRERVYREYAERYLDAHQLDDIDWSKVPGVSPELAAELSRDS